MRRRGLLAGAGLATAAGLFALDAADRRRIAADPLTGRLAREPEGRARTVTSADGTQVHVEQYGPADAPVLVLLHGWTCTLDFWRLQVQDLGADHHVIAYDMRGHGASGSAHGGDWSLDALADDLEAVLDACAGDQPVTLAGHSLGAMTIVAWGGRHRGSVRRRARAAGLLNTGIGDLISESLVIRAPDAAARVRQAVGTALLGLPGPLPPRPDPVTHRAVRYVALCEAAGPAAVRYSERQVLSCRRAVRAAYGRELGRLDLRDRVEHLTIPTLVVAGEQDRLTPPVHARRLAEELPDCAGLLELEATGHMSPLERPDEVSRTLRALVADPYAAAAAATTASAIAATSASPVT